MGEPRHLTTAELEARLEHLLAAPKDAGELRLIVRRPERDKRETLEQGTLDVDEGLVGDNWRARGNRHRPDGSADPEMQINVMNARVAELVAGNKSRMALAGDQLYLDMDLSSDNLPPGTRLAIGEAVIEVTPPPHTGCRKFAERFGKDAVVFVNSGRGKKLNFRGINARVVESGDVRIGDVATKIDQ